MFSVDMSFASAVALFISGGPSSKKFKPEEVISTLCLTVFYVNHKV